jgi:pimeloyl-ACP methyl ester carboxylesterase
MKISKLIPLLLLLVGFAACKTQNTTEKPQTETVAVDSLKSVDIRGEKLHYVARGEGETLIFVHGGISDYRSFFSRVEPYSEDYHVVTYSRRYAWPNAQEFDESVDYSVRIHADDLYALIQKLNLGKVHLVCHSYGAFTALTMALDHPEVVQSLVLGEPPVASLAQNTEKGRESWDAFLENDLRPAKQDFLADKDEEALKHFLKGVFGDDFSLAQVPPEVKQGWMDNLLEIWGLSMSEDFPPLDPLAIQTLDVPVLLIVGERSPTYLQEISNELHRLLPRSEMVRFENMNHGLYFEKPEAVDRAVREFLERN